MRDRTADRLDIAELTARYCTALSDRDWDAWQACFADGAKVDYTTAGGPAGTPAEAAAALGALLGGFESTVSQGGNLTIEFTADDEAKVRSMYRMVMKLGGDTPAYMEASGWYHDVARRTPDGWRLAERVENLLYIR